jgi:hypothetical protein
LGDVWRKPVHRDAEESGTQKGLPQRGRRGAAFVPDPAFNRDLAALIGLGLPEAKGYVAAGRPLREDLACRACGRRGVTLHHVIPDWICRSTGVKTPLEPLCPACHAAAERLVWRAADLALRRRDLVGLAARRRPALAPAIAAWNAWTRWDRRLRNLERAGRGRTPEGEIARREAAAARRFLGRHREPLRAALRRQAAEICRAEVDYRGLAAAWRGRGVGGLRAEDFLVPDFGRSPAARQRRATRC